MQTKGSSNDFLMDFLIGISDGLIIPFGLVVGMSAHFTLSLITTITLCVVLISAIAMGLSRYFSSRESEDDAQLHKIVSSLDLTPDTEARITEEALKANSEWALIMDEVNKASTARQSACYIGVGYLLAGLTPLIPLWLASSVSIGLCWTVGLTLLLLFFFGFFKGKLTGQPAILKAIQSAVPGLAVAMIAFVVGWIFR